MKSELILHCLETNCFFNMEESKTLHGFNMEWLVAYTNQAFSSLKTIPFLSLLLWREKTEIDRGNLISLSQIFKPRWPELMIISIKSEWATACPCQCLPFRPFFSILGTLEWEIDCLPHLGLFITPIHGSFSYMCLLWSVLGWWQRDSSYKETNYFYCLKKGWYRVISFVYQR